MKWSSSFERASEISLLWSGSVKSDKEFRWAKQALDPLDCVHLGGKPLAINAASNFRFLRSKGITIRKTVDMLIGTWCIEHDVELLHNDKEFDQMATQLSLRVYVELVLFFCLLCPDGFHS